VRVLADIGKVAFHRVGNVDFGKADAQCFAQNLRVGAGALGSSKAGHGNGNNVLGVTAQHLAGAHGNQQSQAGIQPAGNTHNSALGVGVLHTLGKALSLDAQNQLAALGASIILRHKWRGGNKPRQRCFCHFQIKADGRVSGGIRHKGRVADTLLHHAAKVQLGCGGTVGERFGLAQQCTVFRNQIVGGKGHIGGAFTVPGVSIHITAQQAGALPSHQLPAVGSFAYRFIAGRKVCNHRCPGQRMATAGGHRGPKVLTDFHPKHKLRHLAAGKQQVGAKQSALPGKGDFKRIFWARHKMAALVKLAVIGQVGFGYKAQQLPLANNRCTVVQLAVMAHRQANQRHHVQLFAGIENLNQPILGAAAQCFLQKQIAAGIAGQGKLRQAEQFGSGNSLCAHGGNDLLRIVGTVSNMQRRADGCCAQKSVFHG